MARAMLAMVVAVYMATKRGVVSYQRVAKDKIVEASVEMVSIMASEQHVLMRLVRVCINCFGSAP